MDARSESLCLMSWTVNPRVPLGTRRPWVLRARPHDGNVGDRTVGNPHLLPLEDPVAPLAPRSRSHRAWVEPESGSVRPKQPIFSPAAICGNHSFFCSSDP